MLSFVASSHPTRVAGTRLSPGALRRQAAAERQLYAHEELAKYYEHSEKNFVEALRWTDAALALVNLSSTPFADKLLWQEPLLHRQNRLKDKIARQESQD